MTTKSHVSIEQHVCPVCSIAHDTGAILLDKRLKQTMHMHTATGYGLCPEHKEKADQGYIALVELDPKRSVIRNDVVKPEDAYRTGRFAHIRREAWDKVFDLPAPELSVVCIEPAVFDALANLVPS
jgi:hypothetical protein